MKITILKEKLIKGLNIVEKIIGKNLTLPILNNVLISAEENFLKLSTTDLELGISYWGLAKVEEKGKITIPVKTLSSFISLLREEKITIETKDKTLFLKGESYKTQIKGLEADDFPIIPETISETSLDIDAKLFSQGMAQVIDFCALTQVRPELSGVYLSFQKNIIKIVSTDSFRLAEKNIFLDSSVKTNNLASSQSLILPKNAARELINIFSEGGEKMTIRISSNQIMAESRFPETNNPHVRLVSRLIEGEYPNYEEVIPKKFKTQIIVSKDAFLSQVKSASLFSGRTNEIKVAVNCKKETIAISSQSVDLGESQSLLPAKIEGEEVVVNFNYKFLVDGLSQIKTSELIFELNGQDGPGVLKPVDDISYLYVIMPVRAS